MKLIPFNQQLSSPSLALCSLVLSLAVRALALPSLSCMTLTIFGNCIDPFPFRQSLRGSLNYNNDSRLHCNNSSAQAEPSRGSAAAAFLSVSLFCISFVAVVDVVGFGFGALEQLQRQQHQQSSSVFFLRCSLSVHVLGNHRGKVKTKTIILTTTKTTTRTTITRKVLAAAASRRVSVKLSFCCRAEQRSAVCIALPLLLSVRVCVFCYCFSVRARVCQCVCACVCLRESAFICLCKQVYQCVSNLPLRQFHMLLLLLSRSI